MKKDIGKQIIMNDFRELMNATIWAGVDPSIISADGYLQKSADIKLATYSAKQAKLSLFEHFMKKSKSQYLFLCEDDIYTHKNYLKQLEMVNIFLKESNPYLLYLGVSNNRKFEYTDNVSIEKLHPTKPSYQQICPGAYAVIINRKIINYLISYIKDESNKYNPFDMTCLGVIQMMFPDKCHITAPPLIIPDVTTSNIRKKYDQTIYYQNACINPLNYVFPEYIPLFIKIMNNINTQQTINLYKIFEPYYKIILINSEDDITTELCKDAKYYVYVTSNIVFKYYSGSLVSSNINKYIGTNKKVVLYNKNNSCFYAQRCDRNIESCIDIDMDNTLKVL